jgi:hypothetical protein
MYCHIFLDVTGVNWVDSVEYTQRGQELGGEGSVMQE